MRNASTIARLARVIVKKSHVNDRLSVHPLRCGERTAGRVPGPV